LDRVFPALFKTILVPKAQELVATPYRFGGDKEKARKFFEEGSAKSFSHMRETQHPEYPLTVYYAFKQSEMDEAEEGDNNNAELVSSTGWETMLEGLLTAGLSIPTATLILDTVVQALYAAPLNASAHQETADVTRLPYPRANVCHPDF
jgi:putative DNA methylase